MPNSGAAWRPHAWRLAALWVLALAAYSNSFGGGFVFDNAAAILRDPRVHAATPENLHLILHEEYWYNSSTTGLYRPLTTLSYLWNYAILGDGANPAGYHWFNFLVHACNIALVYLLGWRLLEDATAGAVLAALWGVHPLLTESVSNIVGRADLLSAFGVLAALLCHIEAAHSSGRRKIALLFCLALAAGIAVFSKEAGAVLPGVMLLHDLTWREASNWRRRLPGHAAMAIPFAIFFSLRAGLLSRAPLGMVPYADNPLFGAGFWTARITAFGIIGRYIALFLWPARQSADYSYNAIPLGASWTLALCLVALALLIVSFRRARPVFFFTAFFFLVLAPTANLLLLIGSVMAERFAYLPCAGLAGCAAWGLLSLSRRFGRSVWAAAGAVCVALAVCTWARNPIWHDDLSLWNSVAAAYPGDFKAHTTLAELYANAGPTQLDRATHEADLTLQIIASLPPDHCSPRPYATAGLCYRLRGDSLPPDAAPAVYAKARDTLLRGEQVDQAERAEIVRINQTAGKSVTAAGWMPLYLELGRVYTRLHDPEKARQFLAYGQAHSPDPEFTIELSHSWQSEGNAQRAAMTLIEPVLAGSTSPRLAVELVSLYKQTAPASCAVRESNGAASVNFDCPLVRDQMCASAQDLSAVFRQAGQAARADAITALAARLHLCGGK